MLPVPVLPGCAGSRYRARRAHDTSGGANLYLSSLRYPVLSQLYVGAQEPSNLSSGKSTSLFLEVRVSPQCHCIVYCTFD